MHLPSKVEQEKYVRAQRDSVLQMKFKKEFEIELHKKLLKTDLGKEESRKSQNKIIENEKQIEGYVEYVEVLNEYTPEKHTELTPNEKKQVLAAIMEEVERGNFRGLLGKQVQERRLKSAKENEAKWVAEDDIEQADSDIEINEITYELAGEWVSQLA